MIDLRSDTVTRPTPEMLSAMMSAEVGDDVYQEDPTINKLEQKVADLFGREAALFCPSGTMCNQIAIKLLTRPNDELICDKNSHIYLFEAGGIAANAGVSVKLLDGERGIITAGQIEEAISEEDVHYSESKLVVIENTMNKGGGSVYSMDEINAIRALCDQHAMAMHLDGARLFNAMVATDTSASEYGEIFETISICLSKGLGAPVGSILIGDSEIIKRGRKIRKSMGGGMRQAGYLAAAGIYALDNHIGLLKQDHERAVQIAAVLNECSFVKAMLPIQSNIIIFTLSDNVTTIQFIDELMKHRIKVSPFGPREIRMVTHLDFNDTMLEHVVDILKKIRF